MRWLVALLMLSALNMPGENKIEQSSVSSPEVINPGRNTENALEKNLEKVPEKIETPNRKDLLSDEAVSLPVSAPLSVEDDYHHQQITAIENIMSSGLDQVFLKMTPAEQQRFKEEGEKTANKIGKLLDKAKTGVDKVISLIKRWLGLIPNVNKFFLEQEAKIKADKILKIKRNL